MVIHFFRRRPEGYWLFVIIFLGPLGALAYFVMEVVPDLRVKPPWLARVERKRRQQWLEARVAESPALESLYELGEIYAAEGDHARALELFARVLARDEEWQEAHYGRARSLMALGRLDEAIADLEPLARAKPNYHHYEAYLSLAECYERAGRLEQAQAAYQDIVGRSTVVLRLRRPAGSLGRERDRTRDDAADSGQEVDAAALLAPPGAPLVPQGRGVLEGALSFSAPGPRWWFALCRGSCRR